MTNATIWYVFERSSGAFAGSGVTQISDADYDSTTTPSGGAPSTTSTPMVYDTTTDTWA